MLRCVIVDDEPIARLGMQRYLEKIDTACIVGVAGKISDLEVVIFEKQPDLIFLDIDMPGKSGIEFLKSSEEIPAAIVITAYPEYALDGYALNLVDYLVKPVSFERFHQAFTKAERLLHANTPLKKENDYLFIRTEGRFEKIFWYDIMYFESMLNYIKIVTAAKTHIVYSSLKGIQEMLPRNMFLRIHKSYIVALSHITALQGMTIYVGKSELPISRAMKNHVYAVVLNGNTI